MEPPFPGGGEGRVRSCRWKGFEAPFHDGRGLASPGRWRPAGRRTPEGDAWPWLGKLIFLEALKVLGSVSEGEREAFRMARGGGSFNLVKDEAFLEATRSLIAKRPGIECQRAPEEVLQEAGDPNADFLERAKTDFLVGVLKELPRTPL